MCCKLPSPLRFSATLDKWRRYNLIMCGITGCFVASAPVSAGWLEEQALASMDELRHRGPDDGGTWVDAGAGLALGHRRLSVIDLSTQGHQPMVSADNRFVIAFNGEIYNFRALRTELETDGATFRGHSDTEVLLASIVRWGLVRTLQRVNGMLSLALWDCRERTLHLARDRFGQKPLYYGWADGALVFGSELSALCRFPTFSGNIDRDSIALLLRHSNIPAPYTIYHNCWKLMPGTVLSIDIAAIERRALPAPTIYWSTAEVARDSLSKPLMISSDNAVDALESLLRDAVGACMVSDAPIGAFLSGGIDSSTIVALMQAQSPEPVRTFSIGFTESMYNEAGYAAKIARHLGTDHTELYVTPADAQAVIPDLPQIYDEPFADSSQIPTHLVSRLAREHVTVSLSGDGGDELFGGYNRYTWSRNLMLVINMLPPRVRRWAVRHVLEVAPDRLDRIYTKLATVIPNSRKEFRFGEKLHKLAEVFDARTKEEMYWRLVSQWKNPMDALLGDYEPPTLLSRQTEWPVVPNFTQQMMLLDTLVYLPDDILVKLDRASMAVSLESRVPFLDHRVFEFAWSLPGSLKIRKGQGKWILRKVLERHVPPTLFDRPKMGFGVPIGDWLRGSLREWAEDLLSPDALKQGGYFRAEVVQKVWQSHLAGNRDQQYRLWPVLMFQSWVRGLR